ncbi:MAG: hypothetical protein ABI809_04105 [Caldimonas sp.]
MPNPDRIEYHDDETELDAYNAAFYELGFRWHWDRNTFDRLSSQCGSPREYIHHYLETHQPHLLKAYDSAFLADVIGQKKEAHQRKRKNAPGHVPSGYFDWSQTVGGELGA